MLHLDSSQSPDQILECFPNPKPDRDYLIHLNIPEFSCLCPKTGQPDFATLKIRYVPDQHCIELKSLKLFVWSYRDKGCFHEKVTNEILDFLCQKISPRYMHLTANFNVRGGIYADVMAERRQTDWNFDRLPHCP